ncbi:MAG: AbrB/MazE/SpoVT family DNA-binding domain-containing protein [Candidatus Omnitrophica bacterium]|nr:AbrB/MazE/SpoVT family DNA-binding domain-containing protein [Candidatus Omnitrophota bacterium]
MTILETAKMTTKGQITIPNRVRKLLRLKQGISVAFGLSKDGVVLMPCEVTAKSPYTPKEWEKIEKLASGKGRTYHSTHAAKVHLDTL